MAVCLIQPKKPLYIILLESALSSYRQAAHASGKSIEGFTN